MSNLFLHSPIDYQKRDTKSVFVHQKYIEIDLPNAALISTLSVLLLIQIV